MIKLNSNQKTIVVLVLAFLFFEECFYIYQLLLQSELAPDFKTVKILCKEVFSLGFIQKILREVWSFLILVCIILSYFLVDPVTASLLTFSFVTTVVDGFNKKYDKYKTAASKTPGPTPDVIPETDFLELLLNFLCNNSFFLLFTIFTGIAIACIVFQRSEEFPDKSHVLPKSD